MIQQFINRRVKICDKFNIQPVDFTRFIKSNPEAIAEVDLSKVTAILSMKNLPLIHGIKIDMVEDNMKRHNLLSSDAIHLSSCKVQNIEYMATNDSDFERVDYLIFDLFLSQNLCRKVILR